MFGIAQTGCRDDIYHYSFMMTKQTSKVIGSPGWHLILGLAFGWVGTAGASELWRNRLFIAGLITVCLMGITELVYRACTGSHNAERA